MFESTGGPLAFLLDVSKAIGTGTAAGQYGQAVVNRALPLAHVAFSECVKCYYQQKMSWSALRFYAGLSGINLPETDGGSGPATGSGAMSQAWNAVVQSAAPIPDLAIFLTHYKRGTIGTDYFERHLKHYGISPANYNWLYQTQPTPPTPVVCLEMLNRGYMTAEDFDKAMNAYGFGLDTDRQNLAKLRFQLPPISDLIRFSVREVWQPDVVRRFGYDAEFPPEFAYWMEKQGLGWTPNADTIPGFGAEQIPWPLAYWRSHWQLMSPTQAYLAFHRLRPRTPGSSQSRIEGVPAFTQTDLDQTLKVQDYPPTVREWLRGLTYSRPTRVDIRRMLQSGLMTEPETVEAYRDLGYTQTDAERLTHLAIVIARDARNRSVLTRLKNELFTAYELGTYDRQTFSNQYFDYLYRDTGRVAALDNATEQMRNSIKANDPAVSLARQMVQLKLANQRIKAAIKALSKAYIEGRQTRDEFASALARAGVAEIRIPDIIARVDWEKAGEGRTPTLERLSRWRQQGILPAGEYREELTALGFTPENANRLVIATEQDIVKELARSEEKLARTTEQAQAAIVRQIKAIRQEQKDAEKRLAKHATRAEVLRWFRNGLIGQNVAMVRLERLGYARSDVELYIEEAKRAQKDNAKRPPAVPNLS